MAIEQAQQIFLSLLRNIGIGLIIPLVISGCGMQLTPMIPANTTPLPLIAIPTATLIASSSGTPTNRPNNRSPIYSIAAILRDPNPAIQTIEFDSNRTYIVDKRLAGLVLINYSKKDNTFMAISFPPNISVATHPLGQVLRTAPAYEVDDLTQPGIAYRYFTEIPPLGEPETAGDACDIGLSGQLTLQSQQPLRGEYQFTVIAS